MFSHPDPSLPKASVVCHIMTDKSHNAQCTMHMPLTAHRQEPSRGGLEERLLRGRSETGSAWGQLLVIVIVTTGAAPSMVGCGAK